MGVINSSDRLNNVNKKGNMGVEYPRNSKVVSTTANNFRSSKDSCSYNGYASKGSGSLRNSIKKGLSY